MPATFQLLAAHPALDFVNTLDNRFVATGPNELLSNYDDLLAFLEQSQELRVRQLSALRKMAHSAQARKALRRAHDLREALASVFYDIVHGRSPAPQSLKRVERYLVAAQARRQLVWNRMGTAQDAAAHAEWQWRRSEADVEFPVFVLAQSAADLLTSSAMGHVRECASPTCRWLFLDTTKNHSRRWCDMALCGNRMKARRFQGRR